MAVREQVQEGNLVLEVKRRSDIAGSQPKPPVPPPVRIAFVGENQVVGLDFPSKGARGEFLTHPDGSIAWLRWGGRIHARQGET